MDLATYEYHLALNFTSLHITSGGEGDRLIDIDQSNEQNHDCL